MPRIHDNITETWAERYLSSWLFADLNAESDVV